MNTITMKYQRVRRFQQSPLYAGFPWPQYTHADRGLQDTILWIHIFMQIFAFGVIFPTGMVLGVSSTRFPTALLLLKVL